MNKMMTKPAGSMWSDDQWQAIARGGDDILVAAAAGSGKTAVLVERIIRKIADDAEGFSVDRLLVATFTKAAAAEMRQRIREALDKALESDPDNEHLRRQLAMLGRASITTLHSFCMEVIRRYYQLIPLDPGFRILNENEANLLRQDTLEELFEEKYGEAEQGGNFVTLADWFSGERSDDALYRLVQRLYDFSRSHPWPDEWLRETASAFRITDTEQLGQTAWVHSILNDAQLALAGAAGLLEQAKAAALAPGGPAPYIVTIEEDLQLITTLMEAVHNRPWEHLYDVFRDVSFGKLKSVRKDDVLPELQNRVKELRDNVKKTVSELKNSLFGRTASQFLSELHGAAPLMDELVETVIAFADRYRAAKASKSTVDFNDLEHYCLKVLRHEDSVPGNALPSDAAMEYRAQFDEVLLDEYQDTNSVQEEIVRLISRPSPGNRFMVGDVKQSIYRFRLAEPGLFLDKYKRYISSSDMPDAPAGEGTRIDLARNFRSRMEVVQAVNMLFRQIMNESVAEIVYDDRAELVCGAYFPDPEPAGRYSGDSEGADSDKSADADEGVGMYAPELLLIDKESPDAGEPSGTEDNTPPGAVTSENEVVDIETAQLEARAIAGRIRELMGDGGTPMMVYDKSIKSMRPAAYGDIVILLRSVSVWAPLMMEELSQEGIPTSGEQSRGYFQAVEVEIMLCLLQVIDNPRQDIPLASVLRSPMVALSEEELAQVRLCASGSFYDAMSAALTGNSLDSKDRGADTASGSWSDDLQLPGWTEAAAGRTELGLAEFIQGTSGHSGRPGVSGELFEKLVRFRDRLESWRTEARQGSLSDLIWRIYSETGYLDWLGGLPGGSQRRANLTALYDRAVQYEQDTSSRGLFRFLTFISRMKDNGGDLGAPGDTESQGNAVRIMTIHKSKGLEFPVVFVAGLSKNFNQQDLNSPFLMHKELGFGPKYVDEQLRVTYPTLPNLAIRRRAQIELLAEEMRVLYVALTRPKEKLILVASVKNLLKKINDWAHADSYTDLLLPDYMLARGRSYLDWIGPAIIRHPSAAVLREAAELPPLGSDLLFQQDGLWNITVKSAEYLITEPPRLNQSDAGGDKNSLDDVRSRIESSLLKREPVQEIVWQEGESPQEKREDLYRRISWSYPFSAASGISAKTSVTEMKKLLAMQDSPSLDLTEETAVRRNLETEDTGKGYTLNLRRPKFMEAVKLTPAERGTVYHTVMQHIPLHGDLDVSIVQHTLSDLLLKEMITREQAEVVSPQEIVDMISSEVGARLVQAEQIWREMPFSYALPASEAYQNLIYLTSLQQGASSYIVQEQLDEECVLIQGVVDCLFRAQGKLILLDYKTDRVLEHRGGIEALTEQYRFQLELYAKALEDILGEPIAESWLYFFDAGQAVRL
ncbi:UvrD-helicase domain-containing protein [Paenibacillus lemnae]|uniref:ATP-dependent helicase/nuclease subunit A n=1 Tax=Paenibacillus lemnae TaxID=1330551 RepID=A0A848M3L4_PAELE|nr:UvrD-helicase domain-containing protein [Paenibacillus lemnae]NMO94839.1 UvrD-helicase domain-containing protein [Paenibacillus lemnae]